MGQYSERVHAQAVKLAAEEWAGEPASIHMHSLKSMWYDNRPQDTDEGHVTDTQFNDGRIVREKDGKIIHIFTDEQVRGEELLDKFRRMV
tara:strand:- start:576 stop:845 length:270 start_codon:yes stop_codon:yes gene_type:complete